MINVKNIFEERVNDIETYFAFLKLQLAQPGDEELKKILKANLLLMLYNVVESSMSNAIEEIHLDIHSKTISFDSLKITLKRLLIQHLKSHLSPKGFVDSINNIAMDTIKQCFDKEKIFSGNVDGRKVKEIALEYGFDHKTNYANTKNGSCLLEIKGRRNDLAHGIFSFTEVGKEYTSSDLEDMKNQTICFIREILNNIVNYLNTQQYLEPPIAPNPPAVAVGTV